MERGSDEVGAAEVPTLGPVLDFLRLIWALDHALQKRSKRMAATLGLTGPQRLVLRIVGRFPGLSAGQLARTLHLHPSTLTGILKRLQRRGLLSRRTDAKDGRRAVFGLTEKGRALGLESERLPTVESAVRGAMARFSGPSLHAAAAVLDTLARSLEDEPGEGASRARPRRSHEGA